MYQPPYSVLKPLRYKVGGPSEVFASSGAAVFCAGMNPLSLKDLVMGCLLLVRSLLGAYCLLMQSVCSLLLMLGACSLLNAGCLIAADGCLLMQELLLDFLPIYEAFAFIVELKA